MSTAFTDPADLADRVRRAARAMEGAEEIAVREISALTKAIGLGKIRSATGGDLVLSGTGRTTIGRNDKARKSKEKKLNIGYDISPGQRGPIGLVSARGPLPLVENDQKPHVVTSRFAVAAGYEQVVMTGKRAGQMRKGRNTIDARTASVLFGAGLGGGRRAVLNFGGGNYRRSVIASSKGRKPWAKTLDEVRPQINRILAGAERKALLSVFST